MDQAFGLVEDKPKIGDPYNRLLTFKTTLNKEDHQNRPRPTSCFIRVLCSFAMGRGCVAPATWSSLLGGPSLRYLTRLGRGVGNLIAGYLLGKEASFPLFWMISWEKVDAQAPHFSLVVSFADANKRDLPPTCTPGATSSRRPLVECLAFKQCLHIWIAHQRRGKLKPFCRVPFFYVQPPPLRIRILQVHR